MYLEYYTGNWTDNPIKVNVNSYVIIQLTVNISEIYLRLIVKATQYQEK